MTFLELYGTELDRELASADRTQRFTTARRKAAINAAQLEWASRTHSYVKRAEIPIGDLATALVDHPLGAWDLDEDDGTTAADATAYDRDGTIVGSPTLGVTDALTDNSPSMTFDGVDDHVTLGDVAAFEFTTGLTAMCWFKTVTPAPALAMMVTKSLSTPAGWGLAQYSGTGKLQGFGFTAAGAEVFDLQSPNEYHDGAWHHAALTFDGTTAKLYADGGLVASEAAAAGTIAQNAAPCLFGAWHSTPTGFFTGSLKRVRLYQTALSAARIAAIAQVGATGELDVDAILGDYVRPAKDGIAIRIVSSTGVRYIEGDDLLLTSAARLNHDVPGWRAHVVGTPQYVYTRHEAGGELIGFSPRPSPASGETWTLMLPYEAIPVNMSADADVPFARNGDALTALVPYHRALVHYAAYDLEKFRKDAGRQEAQLQLWESYITRYEAQVKPAEGQRVRFVRTYRRVTHQPRRFDPRVWP